MSSPLPAILALLTGVAGWFYLFFSRAAHRLAGVEDDRLNRRRVRLRPIGGGGTRRAAPRLLPGGLPPPPPGRRRRFSSGRRGALSCLSSAGGRATGRVSP